MVGRDILNNDLWYLRMDRKEDVPKLLQELPIRHKEKTRKKSLILDTKDAKRWPEVEERVMALRKQIRNEREQCRLEAERGYNRRHEGSVPSAPLSGGTKLTGELAELFYR